MIKKARSFILNMKLKYKLIITYIMISIIPLTIMGVLNIAYTKNNIYSLQKQNMANTLEKLDLELSAKINTINQTCLNVAFNTNTQYILSNAEEINNDLELYGELLYDSFDPLLEIICALDNNIKLIEIYSIHTIPSHDPYLYGIEKLEQNTWYPLSDSFDPFQPYIFSSGNNLQIVYKINSTSSQELLGYIAVTISTKDFFPVSINSIDSQTRFEIQDAQSNMIYKTGEFSQNMISATLYNEATDLQITMHQINNYFTVHNNISIFLIIISCILISCLLILIISLIFSNKMTQRIHRLLEQMVIVSKGNLDIEIISDSTDEIGELTDMFSHLIKQLKQVFEDMSQAKLRAKNSELIALQSQINPHFLYNTLNMIQWKAIDVNSREICDIIHNLSTFYRTALSSGRNIISARDELDNLKSYLSLQQLMQPDKFEIQYEIDPIVLDCKMIKFILQPIAENALEHGFAVNDSQKGVLLIKADIANDKLSFTVSDNGIGMNFFQLEQLRNFSSDGYGLKNIKERLEIKYGTDYDFMIDSVPFKGTTVKIIIPII